jgi:DNA-binding response OmpR family regulator
MEIQQRIMVVDDDQSVRIFLTKALEEYGYKVVAADGGRSALKLVVEFKPDLVLLDVRMPEMNGVEVLKNLTETHPGLPVIMLTGMSDTKLLEQTFDITKPVLASVLVARIRAKLRRVTPGRTDSSAKTD